MNGVPVYNATLGLICHAPATATTPLLTSGLPLPNGSSQLAADVQLNHSI
jgi:hypothetical protein